MTEQQRKTSEQTIRSKVEQQREKQYLVLLRN